MGEKREQKEERRKRKILISQKYWRVGIEEVRWFWNAWDLGVRIFCIENFYENFLMVGELEKLKFEIFNPVLVKKIIPQAMWPFKRLLCCSESWRSGYENFSSHLKNSIRPGRYYHHDQARIHTSLLCIPIHLQGVPGVARKTRYISGSWICSASFWILGGSKLWLHSVLWVLLAWIISCLYSLLVGFVRFVVTSTLGLKVRMSWARLS